MLKLEIYSLDLLVVSSNFNDDTSEGRIVRELSGENSKKRKTVFSMKEYEVLPEKYNGKDLCTFKKNKESVVKVKFFPNSKNESPFIMLKIVKILTNWGYEVDVEENDKSKIRFHKTAFFYKEDIPFMR